MSHFGHKVQLRRKFTVKKAPDEPPRRRLIHKYVNGPDGKPKLTENWEPITEDQFDVRLNVSGDSVRLTKSELERCGFNKAPEIIDIESGEVLPVELGEMENAQQL